MWLVKQGLIRGFKDQVEFPLFCNTGGGGETDEAQMKLAPGVYFCSLHITNVGLKGYEVAGHARGFE